jgi:hypothetical protein
MTLLLEELNFWYDPDECDHSSLFEKQKLVEIKELNIIDVLISQILITLLSDVFAQRSLSNHYGAAHTMFLIL